MISCRESKDVIYIETPSLQAAVRTTGYVSGVMAGSFYDRKTNINDPGFGLHIMDFFLAPGWRKDGYSRNRIYHGNLPKHFVEGKYSVNHV